MVSCKLTGDLVTHNIITAFLENISSAEDDATRKLFDYTLSLNKNIELYKQELDALKGSKADVVKKRKFFENKLTSAAQELDALVLANVSDAPIYKQMVFDNLVNSKNNQALFKDKVDIITFMDDISGKLDLLSMRPGISQEQVDNNIFRYGFVAGLRKFHGEGAVDYVNKNWIKVTQDTSKAIKNKAVYDYMYIGKYGVDGWASKLGMEITSDDLSTKAVAIQKEIDSVVTEKLKDIENPTKEDIDNLYAEVVSSKFGKGLNTGILNALDNDVSSYIIINNINSGLYNPREIFDGSKGVSLPKGFGFKILGTNLTDDQYSKDSLIQDYRSNLYTIKTLPEEDQLAYAQEFYNKLAAKGMIDSNRFANLPTSVLEVAQIFDSLPTRFIKGDLPELRNEVTANVALYKAKNYKFGYIPSVITMQSELKKIYKAALSGGDIVKILNDKTEVTTSGIRDFFKNYVGQFGKAEDAIKLPSNNEWLRGQIKNGDLGKAMLDVSGLSDDIVGDVFNTKYFQDFIASQPEDFRAIFNAQLSSVLKKYKVATIEKGLAKDTNFATDLQAIYKAQFLPDLQERFTNTLKVASTVTPYDVVSRLAGGTKFPLDPEIIYLDLTKKLDDTTDFKKIHDAQYKQNTIDINGVKVSHVVSIEGSTADEVYAKVESLTKPNTVVVVEQPYLEGTEQNAIISKLQVDLGVPVMEPRPGVLFKTDGSSLSVAVLNKGDREAIRQAFPDIQYFNELTDEEKVVLGEYQDNYLRDIAVQDTSSASISIENYTSFNPKEDFVGAKRQQDIVSNITDNRIIAKTYDSKNEYDKVAQVVNTSDSTTMNRILSNITDNLNVGPVQITTQDLQALTETERWELSSELYHSIYNDSAESMVTFQAKVLGRFSPTRVPGLDDVYSDISEIVKNKAIRDDAVVKTAQYIERNGIILAFDWGNTRKTIDYVMDNWDTMPATIDRLLKTPGNEEFMKLPKEIQSFVIANAARNQDVLMNRAFLTKYAGEIGPAENATKAANVLSLIAQGVEDTKYIETPSATMNSINGVFTSKVDNSLHSALYNKQYIAKNILDISKKEIATNYLSVFDDAVVGRIENIKNKYDGKQLDSYQVRFDGVVDSYVASVSKAIKSGLPEQAIRQIHTDHVAQLNVLQRDLTNQYGVLFDNAGGDGIAQKFGLRSRELYFVRNKDELALYKNNIASVKNVYGSLITDIAGRLDGLQARFNQGLKSPEAATKYKTDLYASVMAKGYDVVLMNGEPVQITIDDILRKSVDDISEYTNSGELPTQVAQINDVVNNSLGSISNNLKRRYFTVLKSFEYTMEHEKFIGTAEQALKNAAQSDTVNKFVDNYELTKISKSYSPFIKPEYQDAESLIPKYIAEDSAGSKVVLSSSEDLLANDARQIDGLIKSETLRRMRSIVTQVGTARRMESIDGFRNAVGTAITSAIAVVNKYGLTKKIEISVPDYIDATVHLYDPYFEVQMATRSLVIDGEKMKGFFTTANLDPLIQSDIDRFKQLEDTYAILQNVSDPADLSYANNISVMTDNGYKAIGDIAPGDKSLDIYSTGTKYLQDGDVSFKDKTNTLSKVTYSGGEKNGFVFDDFPASSWLDNAAETDCI